MSELVNVIVPINGSGSRFKTFFKEPKPLIKIFDKEMIFWLFDSLDHKHIHKVIIPYRASLAEHDFENKMRSRYPHLVFVFTKLEQNTKGAAETIKIAVDKLGDDDLSFNFMCFDCDTFYHENVIEMYLTSKNKNAIFYFTDTNSAPIFSYIEISESGFITDIREKEKISDFANCGIFCFDSGYELKNSLNHVVKNGIIQKNELYISGAYKSMLNERKKIVPIMVTDFDCVGTPEQLNIFINKERA